MNNTPTTYIVAVAGVGDGRSGLLPLPITAPNRSTLRSSRFRQSGWGLSRPRVCALQDASRMSAVRHFCHAEITLHNFRFGWNTR